MHVKKYMDDYTQMWQDCLLPIDSWEFAVGKVNFAVFNREISYLKILPIISVMIPANFPVIPDTSPHRAAKIMKDCLRVFILATSGFCDPQSKRGIQCSLKEYLP